MTDLLLPLLHKDQEERKEQAPNRARARVMLTEPVGLLDYLIPEALVDAVAPGQPVKVPLRKRTVAGYVAAIEKGPGPEGVVLKEIQAIDSERPVLPASVIEAVQFASDYYMAPPSDVLAAALPVVPRRSAKRFRITDKGQTALADKLGSDDRTLLEMAAGTERDFSVAAVERVLQCNRRSASQRLRRLEAKGWLTAAQSRGGRKRLTAFRRLPVDPEPLLTSRQQNARKLLDAIPADQPMLASALVKIHGGAYRLLKTLERLGLVERLVIEQWHKPTTSYGAAETQVPVLTDQQADAVNTLQAALDQPSSKTKTKTKTYLMRGVTGSGKTEVYMRLIERVLGQGKTALVLVPEIALTPQLGARFRQRFGQQIATFHSGLTRAERRDEWERVAAGEVTIALGARSAVFLPLCNVGVIIVDEEHETSFKQEESPRYNARDLAVWRGRREGALVVLGSATPSLESTANASDGRYGQILLPQRVHERPMPESTIVDLAKASMFDDGIFTTDLADRLERTVAAGHQAILFLNRRGYAPYAYCRDCGKPFRCDDCDVALTVHRGRELLLCHYCGFELRIPEECPSCNGLRLQTSGLGTERVELELRKLIGDLPMVRLDRDTVRGRGDLERHLERFRLGEARVLIGTQMVTKGHDFPGVTLVGILSADSSLNFPDFRAAERTFQLITQVAGRAGRGEHPGEVLVQAYETEHYAVQAALRHDYETFAQQELEERRLLGWPPFTHLVMLRFEGANEQLTQAEADRLAELLRQRAGEGPVGAVDVRGPATAPLARLRGQFRFQVLLKGPTRGALRQLFAAPLGRAPEGVRRVLDVDPVSML